MQGFQTALAKAASDKGLANYDRSNGFETLLKDIINLHKNVLTAVSVAVYNIPFLGPLLGPSEYQCPLWCRVLKLKTTFHLQLFTLPNVLLTEF